MISTGRSNTKTISVMMIEEIKNIKSDKSEWKKFGMTMGVVLLLIGLYLLWKGKHYYPYALLPALFFFFTGFMIPAALKHVYKAWMALSVVMGFIMNRVIMIMAFYLILTPIGLIASLTGKDFLDKKIDRNAKSYWIARNKIKKEKSDYERQF